MRRVAILTCFVLAASGAIVGCGGTGPTAIMVFTTAATKTQAAKTARVSFKYTLKAQTFQTDGVADLANGQATYTTKVPGLGSIEAIQNGTTMYEKVPAQLAALIGKPWVKFDLATGLHKLTGLSAQFLSQSSANNDPTSALDYLRGATHDVHKVGADNLHGAQTTRYRGTLDLHLAAANETNTTRKAGLEQVSKLLGVNTFTVDVWIDSDGRLRQMRYSLDTSKFHLPTGVVTPTGTATYTFEFYDFGVSFSPPRLPSPAQVIDITHALATGPRLASTPPSSGVPLSAAIISAPASFVISTSPDVQNGPIDAAGFAKRLRSKSLADQFHFVAGYDETFDNSVVNASVEVTLLQFVSPTAAATFDETTFNGLASNGMVATRNTALPASIEFNSSKTDSSDHYEHIVIARKQNRVLVVDYSNRLQDPAPLAKTIAQREYGRL
jgi:hypothetical protein